MTLSLAFEVDELLVGEYAAILAGSADPSVALVDRPQGSLYLRTNGEVWRKSGSLPNAWVLIGTGTTTPSGVALGNVDGGFAVTNYGGGTPLDGGGASGG